VKPFDKTTTTAASRSGGSTPRDRQHISPAAEACATLLLETVPRIMRALRQAITTLTPQTLTIPQFRTLHFVQTHTGAGLSATAEFLGLTLPSTSKLVDHMVRSGYLARDDNAADRRRMTLRLTPRGDALLKGAQASVRLHLAGTLNRFGQAELGALHKALGLLQESFPSPPGAEACLSSPSGSPANSCSSREPSDSSATSLTAS